VLDQGIPLLTRDLTVGTRKIREDLQRERGVSADDAEAMLKGFERSPDLDPYVQGRGEEIAVGVERASAFLQSASREAGSIERVYCCGGGARVPGLTDILHQRLNMSVEVANPIQRLSVKDGVFDAVNLDEVAPLLMLATGLALRSV